MSKATITISGPAKSREIQTKQGAKLIHYQDATFESPNGNTRFPMEHELRNAGDAMPPGTVLEWDVASDIAQGRFGPELRRDRTLTRRPAVAAAKAG